MRIHGLTISVDYGDFLKETLPSAFNFLDTVTVMTSPTDTETLQVCRDNGTEPIQTEAWWRHEAAFDKGGGLNEGLSTLPRGNDDWYLLFDSDILFPSDLRISLPKLDTEALYGIDRFNVVGPDELARIRPTFSASTTDPLTLEERFFPFALGFFQLYHCKNLRTYPCGPTAADTDLMFSKSFHASKRKFLEGLSVGHLLSEAPVLGHNWRGRKSKPF